MTRPAKAATSAAARSGRFGAWFGMAAFWLALPLGALFQNGLDIGSQAGCGDFGFGCLGRLILIAGFVWLAGLVSALLSLAVASGRLRRLARWGAVLNGIPMFGLLSLFVVGKNL